MVDGVRLLAQRGHIQPQTNFQQHLTGSRRVVRLEFPVGSPANPCC